MSLRPLLTRISEHPDAARLHEQGGRAFVSMSLRPALISALADRDPSLPTVVVAGDDRHARELAAGHAPVAAPARRPLLPQPRRHLRVAPHAAAAPHRPARRRARRAARRRAARRWSSSAPSRCPRRCPDPSLRPHGLRIAQGRPARPRRAGQRPGRRRLRARRAGRGPRPVRHARRHRRPLPGHRGARGPHRAVRHRGRVAALVLDLHPAQPGGDRRDRDRAGRRAGARAPRAGRDRRARRRAARHRRAAADGLLPRAARPDPRPRAA